MSNAPEKVPSDFTVVVLNVMKGEPCVLDWIVIFTDVPGA